MSETSVEKMEFVVCLRNDGYPVSLEPRKLYQMLPDPEAVRHHQLRVVDESGEDYLYPAEYFVAVDLPGSVIKAIRNAA